MKFAIFSILVIVLLSVTIAKRRSHHRRHRGGPNDGVTPVRDTLFSNIDSSTASSTSSTSSSSTSVTTTVITQPTTTTTTVTRSSWVVQSNEEMISRASDVSMDNDGKGWVVEGITGFPDCHYDAFPSQGFIWKENADPNYWYKFLVFKGRVGEVDKSTTGAPVKSFKVPKGFKLEYKGLFVKNKYSLETMSKEEKGQIEAISDGSFARKVETWTDEKCSITNDYWYMNMRVTAHEYVKITRRIPIFLSLCIENQKLNIKRKELKALIDKYETDTNNDKKKLQDIENTLLQYEKLLQEKKAIRQKYQAQLEIVWKIVKNKITVDQWISEVKGYQQIIDSLQIEISNIQNNIASIKQFISNLKKKNDDNNKENIELEKEIARVGYSRTEVETTKTTTEEEIKKIEITILESNNKAAGIKTEKYNLNSKIQNYKEEIARLQELQKQAEDELKSKTNNYNELIKEITRYQENVEITRKTLEEIKTKITQITTNSDQLRQKVINNNKNTSENNDTIMSKEKEILKLEANISKLRSDINSKSSYAEKMTREFYEKEENELTLKITAINKEIDETTSSKTSDSQITIRLKDTIKISEASASSERTSLNMIEQSYNNQYAKVMAEFNNIKSIFSEQTQTLSEVINFTEERVEVWTVSAKTKITKYLQLVPGNPTPIFDMARRRRRLRRYRRRFY